MCSHAWAYLQETMNGVVCAEFAWHGVYTYYLLLQSALLARLYLLCCSSQSLPGLHVCCIIWISSCCCGDAHRQGNGLGLFVAGLLHPACIPTLMHYAAFGACWCALQTPPGLQEFQQRQHCVNRRASSSCNSVLYSFAF